MNKGKFPEECPNCKKSDDLEYGDFDFNSTLYRMTQIITCFNCDKRFKEIFTVEGWEEIKAE